MKTGQFERLLAWLLIVAMCNPAWALDTDIYRAVVTGSSAAEPNVLLILDTSDSMNLPEGWREYPGAYDSHVEYLWNDLDVISFGEVRYERYGTISDGNGYAVNTPEGFYVFGVYNGVPAYQDKVVIMFPDTSAYRVGGSITLTGMPIPELNGSFTITNLLPGFVIIARPPGVNWNNPGYPMQQRSSNVQLSYWNNDAGTMSAPSGTGLLPAPTTPLGFWGGASVEERKQIWQAALAYALATEPGDPGPRYVYRNYSERNALHWLPAGTAESDPRLYSNAFNQFFGADALTTFGGTIDPVTQHLKRGGIDFGAPPAKYYGQNNQCQSSLGALTPSTVFAPSAFPPNAGKYLDQKWQRYERYLNLDSTAESRYPGNGGRAFHTDMDPSQTYYLDYLNANRDQNNFVAYGVYGPLPVRLEKPGNASYAGWTDLKPDWGGFSFMSELAANFYGYTFFKPVLSLYGVNVAGINNDNDARILGYQKLTVPGYYDTSNTVNTGATTVTKTRNCSWSGPVSDGPDAITQTFSFGGICSDAGIRCDGTRTQCNDIPDPPACAQTVAGPYYTKDFNNCHWNGRSQLDTAIYSGCQWSPDRTSVTVGGEGASAVYFVGGVCAGSCTGPGCQGDNEDYCVNSTVPNQRLGNTNYHNVLSGSNNSLSSGCSNKPNGTTYYYGGSCVGNINVPPGVVGTSNTGAACDKSVTDQSLQVGNQTLADVRTDSITAGCSDKPDFTQQCSDRNASGCPYLTCASRASSGNVDGVNYRVADRVADQEMTMVHDCVADEGNNGPYMTERRRDFGANGSPYDGRYNGAAGDTRSDRTLMYDRNRARRISDAPAYDIYSTNYLNWKYGPKFHGNPIGRKTRLQTAKDALTQLVQNKDGVRFGLMVFNRLDNSYNTEGGNIVYAVARMGTNNPADISAMSAAARAENDAALANRQVLIGKINGLVATAQTPLTESLYEAYRYFRGDAPDFGRLSTPALDGSKAASGCDRKAFETPGDGSDGSDCLGNADHPGASGNYHSPMLDLLGSDRQPALCQKNFTLLVTDGGPENDWSANDQIKALSYQKSATEVVSPRTDVNTPAASPATPYNQFSPDGVAPFGPTDNGSLDHDGGYIWLDELSSFMAHAKVSPDSIDGSQPVYTYAIGFAGASTPVLQHAASAQSGGEYFSADSSGQLPAELSGAIDAMVSWTPVSGGGTVVPISALNRAENSRDVYLGFFGPSNNSQWDGTLKRYELSDVTAAGATGYCGRQPVAGNDQGLPIGLCLIGQTAVTNGLGETVWNIEYIDKTPVGGEFASKINDAAVSQWIPSAVPDGGSARRGGSGQILLSGAAPVTNPAARKLYTFIAGVSGDVALSSNPVSEDNALLTKARLGNDAMSDAGRATLINFARGGDPSNAACSDSDPATPCKVWRDWAHGDILHSKPAILNYSATRQFVFYLSTDGLLHAVDTATGAEQWAFMAEEALPLLSTMMADRLGGHLIVTDGSPSLFVHDANNDGMIRASDGDKAMLYFGQRRGGSAYYAVDISDIDHPKFAWKIIGGKGVAGAGSLCVGSGSCSAVAAYDELGQSWSYPAVGKLRALTPPVAATLTPALIFGGGYDPNEDNDPVTAIDTMGRALYVVNGYTGAVVRKFSGANTVHGMDASFPSDAAALNVDLDAQNLLDRVYIGDAAANLYRFDIDNADPAHWTGGRIAQLSDAYSLPGTAPNRKILFPPMLVKQNFGGRYDAVYVGTGDREHPLKTAGVADKMFMIKDNPLYDADYTLAASYSADDLIDISGINDQTGFDTQVPAATWKAKKGWYYSLPGSGEKVTSSPTIFSQTLRFASYAPLQVVNTCLPSGRGQLYGLNALSGAPLDPGENNMLTSNPRVYADFSSRGYISSGVPIVYNKRAYILQVTESGHILPGGIAGNTVGKIYWYREADR
ncbi:MAG TPA: hypothetical protein VMV33_13755 [Rhodocyclaceae bacterium]|nr:hypothetical protein [Rhodocyclaceae bacterium]